MTKYNLKRKDVFITTKLWNTFHRKEHIEEACLLSLKDLKLDYLDCYLMHWPIAFKLQNDWLNTHPTNNGKTIFDNVPLSETWTQMQNLVKKGFVKTLGVSNFTVSQLKNLIKETGIVPVLNQVEFHPYLNQKELYEFCKANKIQIEAYSPLGSGTDHPGKKILLQDPIVDTIAKKHKKTPAQILLRWNLELNLVTLPKSVSPKRIEENFQIFDFQLDQEDLVSLDKLNYGIRYVSPTFRDNWN